MAQCWNCKNEISDDTMFCMHCGAPVNKEQAEAYDGAMPEAPKKKLSVGQLIFSIINLVCCCTPFGIAGIILTVLAANEEEDKANGKLKIAKILNIIGVVGGAIINIGFIVLMVIAMLSGEVPVEEFALM